VQYLSLFAFLSLSAATAFEDVIKKYEQHYDIPTNLLQAIATVESGKADNGYVQPWPWTVQANGHGYYCATKAQAIALVQHFQSQGLTNIDVGFMQINLKSHPLAFQNLSAAFDQTANIAYAAKFLKGLYDQHKSWAKAVAYYHSTNQVFYKPYITKVYKTLQSLPPQPVSSQGFVRFSTYHQERGVFEPEDFSVMPKKKHIQPSLKVRSYQVKLSPK